MDARVLTGSSCNLGSEQSHDDAVFIRCPRIAILPEEGSARAFLAAEAEAAVEQAIHEPLEADRNLYDRSPHLPSDPVNEAAADQRLAYAARLRPIGPVTEEVP